MRVTSVKLHAHRRTRDERQLRDEFRPGKSPGVGHLAQQTEVGGGDGDGHDAARAHPRRPLVRFAHLLALASRQSLDLAWLGERLGFRFLGAVARADVGITLVDGARLTRVLSVVAAGGGGG